MGLFRDFLPASQIYKSFFRFAFGFSLNACRLIAPGTVEEKIWKLQRSKARTIAGVLGGENFARSLTAMDLDWLFAED